MNTTETPTIIRGGEWLVMESDPAHSFIREDFTEEQNMISDMCDRFLDAEVMPILDRIDSMEPGLMKSLVQKSRGAGLISHFIP